MEATVIFQANWDAIHALNPDGSRRYRYIINTGSSRSSKTASLIQCCDLYARENEDKRITAWRDTKTDCKKTVLHDVLQYFKMWGTYLQAQTFNKTESIFTYATGSTLEIHGTDDEESVMGLNKAVTWLNEPYKISRDTFDQLDQRTEDFVLIDWNPKKSHWVEDIAKDPRAIVIHSTFRDNPFCPPEQRHKILSYQPLNKCAAVEEKLVTEQHAVEYDYVANPLGLAPKMLKELIRCRLNEDKRSANAFNWDVYGLGLKAERPNRIFKWKPISLEAYRALDAPTLYGVDWGTVDPWGIIEAKYYDGALYLRELNYASENQWREKLTATELQQITAADAGQQESTGIVTWLFAKLGINRNAPVICDTNRPLKGAALRRAGYNALPAIKASGSIVDGIDLLNNVKVYYTSDSANLAHEQENYSRKVDRYGVVLEEPEDFNNHLIDPARYLAIYLQAQGILKGV